MKFLILAFVIAAVLVSQATAGSVVINGRCVDCLTPERGIVFGRPHSVGRPGQGTEYHNSPAAYPGPRGGPTSAHPVRLSHVAEGRGGVRYPQGYSGPIPGNTYLHNANCVGCSISGGGK